MADLTPLGIIQFRGKEIKFGIKRDDRRRHIYAIGKTGSGKTTLLENMIIHDIATGEGLGFFDPHGDSVFRLLRHIPKERVKDVVFFNPSDLDYPIAFNPIENVPWEHRHVVASSIMSVFKKIWVDAWSARMEYILNNTLMALLETSGTTLLDINRMLGEEPFRKDIIAKLRDPVVKAFWENEFAKYPVNFRAEAVAPIQNKVGQFGTNPLIRNIIGQSQSRLDLRKVMDEKKIFLANLSKGMLGEESSLLIGGLLITKFQLAAMSRVDIPEAERKDFFLYIDEFQNFSTESFVSILSEARKYRLNLILAHQYLTQVLEEIVDSVFGNVGTMIIFKIGSTDAEIFEKEFGTVVLNDFVNLPKYHAYIKLLVDGVATRPLLAITFAPSPGLAQPVDQEIIHYSRLTYASNREIVEAKISRQYKDERMIDQIKLRCDKCRQEFLGSKERGRVCPSCRELDRGQGLSLGTLNSGGLVEKMKKERIVVTPPIDHLEGLLKRLQKSDS